jgi:hypothetical protein
MNIEAHVSTRDSIQSDQYSQETVLNAVSDIMLTIGRLEQWSSAWVCENSSHQSK